MEQVKFLPLLIICVQTAKGFTWNSSPTSFNVCVGNNISLNWVYNLESGEFVQEKSWTKSDGAGGSVLLANDVGGFSPEPAYAGRLIWIGNAGIEIYNATSSDIGTYNVGVTLSSAHKDSMNATVRVHEIANASCIPTCDSRWKCHIPQACPVQKYIEAVWTVDGFKYRSVSQFSPNNYNKPYNVCAEGDAVTSCYKGSPLCREENVCRATATSTPSTSTPYQSVFGLSLGLYIQCVTGIVVVIFRYTGYQHAYISGLVHGRGSAATLVGCIIIGFFIHTCTKNELGYHLILGSGILHVFTISIAGMVVFISSRRQLASEGIHNIYELCKGILDSHFIRNILTYLIGNKYADNSQGLDDKITKVQQKLATNPEVERLELTEVSPVQTYVGLDANFSFMLTDDPYPTPVFITNGSGRVVMTACGTRTDPVYKDRVNFTVNTDQKLISFILRNVTLSDAGIYIAVHSYTNRIIGRRTLIVQVDILQSSLWPGVV